MLAFLYRWKSWMIKQLCSIQRCSVMRNQDPQVETGALPDSKKEAFHRSTRGELVSFFPVFQFSYRSCSHWLYPPALACGGPAIHSPHARSPTKNSRRSSRTKTLSAPIRQRVARTGDTERRREGGTEAPGVLTGQLEGANLLSERNIPDRVGMQQGDGPSGGLGEEAPSGAPWGCWLI